MRRNHRAQVRLYKHEREAADRLAAERGMSREELLRDELRPVLDGAKPWKERVRDLLVHEFVLPQLEWLLEDATRQRDRLRENAEWLARVGAHPHLIKTTEQDHQAAEDRVRSLTKQIHALTQEKHDMSPQNPATTPSTSSTTAPAFVPVLAFTTHLPGHPLMWAGILLACALLAWKYRDGLLQYGKKWKANMGNMTSLRDPTGTEKDADEWYWQFMRDGERWAARTQEHLDIAGLERFRQTLEGSEFNVRTSDQPDADVKPVKLIALFPDQYERLPLSLLLDVSSDKQHAKLAPVVRELEKGATPKTVEAITSPRRNGHATPPRGGDAE